MNQYKHSKFANLNIIMVMFILFTILFFLAQKSFCDNGFVWTAKSNCPTSASGGSAIATNGKIYRVGGYYDGIGYLNNLDVYDIATDSWIAKMSMPTARTDFAVGLINNKIYVVGGYGNFPSSNYRGDMVEVYDIATDSWTTKTNMPTPRSQLLGVAVDNKLYAIGGSDSNVPSYSNINEEYDANSNTWITKSLMSVQRFSSTAVNFNGQIYVFGGIYAGGMHINSVEKYDPNTDIWSFKTQMPYPYYSMSAVVVSSKIYVMGGEVGSYVRSNLVQEYDPATDTWNIKRSLPEKYRFSCAAQTTYNNKVYLIGGKPCGYIVLEGKIDNYPELSWDDGYLNTGFKPSSGTIPSEINFKVKYLDPDNAAPCSGYPKLHVLKAGSEIDGSPFEMQFKTGDNKTGAIYEKVVLFDTRGNDYKYYFEVRGEYDEYAYFPAAPSDGPTLTTPRTAYKSSCTVINCNLEWGDVNITVQEDSFSDDIFLKVDSAVSPLETITDKHLRVKISDIVFTIENEKNLQPTKDITMTFSYEGSNIKSTEHLVVGRYDLTLNRWIILPSIIDTTLKQITATTNHLSKFALLNLIVTPPNNLSDCYCYPSPAVLSKGDTIRFANFTPNARISIHTPAGQLVKSLEADSEGLVPNWDGTTDTGDKLASGVYLVHAKDGIGNRRVFEIAVVK